MRKNTNYIRPDSTAIATTDLYGLFPTNLSHSLSASSTSVWTGLNSNYTAAAESCSNWTSTSGTGQSGLTSTLDTTAIANTTSACSLSLPLVCIEDPETPSELLALGSPTIQPPVITTSTPLEVDTRLSGTSSEPDGTVIVLYANGTSLR